MSVCRVKKVGLSWPSNGKITERCGHNGTEIYLNHKIPAQQTCSKLTEHRVWRDGLCIYIMDALCSDTVWVDGQGLPDVIIFT